MYNKRVYTLALTVRRHPIASPSLSLSLPPDTLPALLSKSLSYCGCSGWRRCRALRGNSESFACGNAALRLWVICGISKRKTVDEKQKRCPNKINSGHIVWVMCVRSGRGSQHRLAHILWQFARNPTGYECKKLRVLRSYTKMINRIMNRIFKNMFHLIEQNLIQN